ITDCRTWHEGIVPRSRSAGFPGCRRSPAVESSGMKALVIIVRGLHLGYLGCYGNEWIATPGFDRLAAEGAVFDQHFADWPSAEGAMRAWQTARYVFPGVAAESAASLD